MRNHPALKAALKFVFILPGLTTFAVVSGESEPRSTPLLPQREISGFSRFIPDEAGEIQWKITGSFARFLTPNLVDVSDFTAAAVGRLSPLVIKTPKLLFDLTTNTGRAEEEWAEVRQEKMVLGGRGVVWDSSNRQIRFVEDVRFLIEESGGRGFFPL